MTSKKTKVESSLSGEESLRKRSEMMEAEAVELNADLDKLNNPTLENGKTHMLASKQSWDKGISQEQAKMNTALDDVHNVFRKWLYIEDTDRLDLALAVGINYREKGTPLWIFFVASPGDWKSELLMSFIGLPDVIMLDQITKNTLASGYKDAVDLGAILQGKRHLLIFSDMACLLSSHKDDLGDIASQLRELYEGRINKKTGSGVSRKYDNCHVNIIAGATPFIRTKMRFHQRLGPRELMYEDDPTSFQDDLKMDQALLNEEYEEEMRKDLHEVVSKFCFYHKLQRIKMPKGILDFIKKEALRLSVLRATGEIDWSTGELKGSVTRELPTRAVKQFKRLYLLLMGLDPNYSDKSAKRIISKLVNSSGSQARQKIITVFKLPKNKEELLSVPDLQLETGLGRKVIKAECEILTYLHKLKKTTEVEHFGGEGVRNQIGEIAWSRGFDREVDRYQAVTQKEL